MQWATGDRKVRIVLVRVGERESIDGGGQAKLKTVAMASSVLRTKIDMDGKGMRIT